MSKLESSPEHPLPLRRVSAAIAGWVHRLGEVWVEGQVAQLTRRPGVQTTFLTVRDTDANISMTVTAASTLVDSAQIAEGARIVMRARPDFYAERGTLSLRASAIRQVGTGELLVRIEQLKRLLAAEGLFAADRKRPLPFWPLRIGLISGRSSAAAHDVVENARRRFPAAQFEVESVATQGPAAVSEIVAALGRLDAASAVSVIVIARGGGSVEDLLPFSNETLLRAVAATRTPVVSAIGHETDAPLLDLVADLACSTPTDAGKRIVPDRDEEERLIARMRSRARQVVKLRLDRDLEAMAELPRRLTAVLTRRLDTDRADVQADRDRARRRMAELLEANRAELTHIRARVIALSPKATLRRGYAVVIAPDGTAVRAPDQAHGLLTVYVEHGSFGARAVPDGG
jgi:exodeoxyribonuclease VII large subunit